MTTYRLNEELNGVEIIFDKKPADEIREELKANGFRWGRGYWYAKQTADRIALAERLANGTQTEAPKTEAKTEQNRIRIYWNGFKLDGANKMTVKVGYSIDKDTEAVRIYARDYTDLPRDLFEVKNDTDIYTDYFDEDRATVDKAHPLYKYIYFAACKARARDLPAFIAMREEWAKHGGAAAEAYRANIEEARAQLAAFEAMTDPGQPTAADLEAIDRSRQEEENARREAEHAAEIEERERVLRERSEGREYIENIAAAYPIEDGAPVVEIPFSENPAFYSFMVEDQKKITINTETGEKTEEITQKMPRCRLSVKAADIVLKHFDDAKSYEGCGYDKTDFVITWTDESGEPWEYSGRYDLGDRDGGLIEHIRALAEWDKTHDRFGHPTDTPQPVSESRFAWVALLERFAA